MPTSMMQLSIITPSRLLCSKTLLSSKSLHQTTLYTRTDALPSCAADRYGLNDLKRLALRKQGLQSNVAVSTILASARWAYRHTPDDDSKLRGHYLALIIRSRNTFKRSGAMKTEMEQGGKLFFDLFVAMCNHIVCSSTPCLSLILL